MNKRNVFALAGLATLLGALPLAAATFTVTRFDDPAPATCSATSCSLREAVIAANATAVEDVIELAAGTYELKHDAGTDPESFDLDVSQPLRIVGQGAGVTVIRNASAVANEHTRIVEVGKTALSLSGLSLQEGHVYSLIPPIFTPLVRGGCLEAWNATLALSDVEVTRCKLVALGGYGGGIGMFQTAADLSQVSIRSSSTPQSWGGGLAAIDSLVQLSKVDISYNAAEYGGGMMSAGTTVIDADALTVTRNEAKYSGGGIYVWTGQHPYLPNATDLNVAVGSLIADNVAREDGGRQVFGHRLVVAAQQGIRPLHVAGDRLHHRRGDFG